MNRYAWANPQRLQENNFNQFQFPSEFFSCLYF